MKSSYQLYGRPGSGNWSVQVMLEEIGAPYERFWVARDAAEVAKLKQIIPTGKVPALVLTDGTILMESAAMLIHLAAAYPQFQLAPPPGSSEHAVFLQWMVFLSANVYESALRMFYPERYTSDSSGADGVRAQAESDHLAQLRIIAQRLDPYLLGGQFSIADVYLYMLVSWWPHDRAALYRAVPGLEAHVASVAARPAVIKVEADHAA